MTRELDPDRRWREGVNIQDRMHRVEERLAAGLREHVETYPGTNQPKLACPVCGRSDITLKKDGTVRVHGSGKKDWPPRNCPGSKKKPKED